jgi:hypothetical protein
VAAAAPNGQSGGQSEGFFSSLARKVGLAKADTTATMSPPAKPKMIEAKPAPRPEAPKATAAAKPAETKAAETRQAAARPPLKPAVTDAGAAPTDKKDTLVVGAAPIVSPNSFDSRFSAMK